MPMNPRLLRPLATALSPRQIAGLVLWLDAADSSLLYTTDAGPVEAVSSPLDISGCDGWWDGSDATTMFDATSGGSQVAAGGAVARWEDKSGNGKHATQASAANRPTLQSGVQGGQSVVRFDGAGDHLTTALADSSQQTIFLVAKAVTPTGSQRVFSYGTNRSIFAGFTDFRWWSGNFQSGASSTSFGVVAVVIESDSSLDLFGNGLRFSGGDPSDAGATNATIGSESITTNSFNGDIAEIIVYDTALSTADRARVEAYLQAKWATPAVHTPATATSDPVGYWGDKSGNGRHATQAKAANRPTVGSQNGRTALTFDGTSSWMRTERTQYAARSVFTVFRRTAFVSSSSYKAVFAKQQSVEATEYGGSAYNSAEPGGFSVASSATSNRFYWNNAALSAAYVQGASMPLADAANYQVGVPAALDTVTPAILYAEVAGEASGNQAWFVGTEPYGLARKYPADVLECLIYNRTLSAAERQKVEGYIAWKWGLQAQLPYDHPYAKSFAGYGSQDTPTDADALDYLSRMATADGAGVEVGVAVAVDRFIKACKADNIWDSIRASCVLAGARTLAGALVPIKNEGPELWTAPTPTIVNGGGSCGEWDAETNTLSNDCVGTTASFPYLLFDLGLSTGKQYVVSGRLTGDLDKLYSGNPVRLGTGGLVTFNSQTGVLSGTVTPSGGNSASMWLLADATESPLSVTIESMSIREVIDDPINSPVGNGFVSGDYSRTAGLKGDGTSYIDTSRANNDDPKNDNHNAVYISSAASAATANHLASDNFATGGNTLAKSNTNGVVRNRTSTAYLPAGAGVATGLFAVSRSNGSDIDVLASGVVTEDIPSASTEPVTSSNLYVFRAASGTAYPSDATIAFYSIGTSLGTDPAVGLADLDTAVTNLLIRMKFALLTGENPAPYDIDTLDYVVRGYENGGSLQ